MRKRQSERRFAQRYFLPRGWTEMRRVLDSVLTDTFYAIFLGLDGSTAIGDVPQQEFRITLEYGSDVSHGGGELEALSYAYFQQ